MSINHPRPLGRLLKVPVSPIIQVVHAGWRQGRRQLTITATTGVSPEAMLQCRGERATSAGHFQQIHSLYKIGG